MLKSALHSTLRWLCLHWVSILGTPSADAIRDSFLRFNAAVYPETEHDIYRNYALDAHRPGSPGYRLINAGLTLSPTDFNPINSYPPSNS